MFKYVVIGFLTFLLLAGAGAGGYYYYYVYPPVGAKRATLKLLEKAREAMESRDRQQVYDTLMEVLTQNASIDLQISFRYIAMQDGAQVNYYHFAGAQHFTQFIQGVLNSSTAFGMPQISLDSFEFLSGQKMANVKITSEQWADAQSFFAGPGINTRYETKVSCDAEVSFIEPEAQVQKLDCNVQLRHVPRPEELEMIKNPVGVQSPY